MTYNKLVQERLAGLRRKVKNNTALAIFSVTDRLLKSGFSLPSDGDEVSHFLLIKAEDGVKISTLRNYCSMIIKWHRLYDYGELAIDIADKAIPVINGLQIERQEAGQAEFRKTATPLQLADALKIDSYLLNRLSNAVGREVAMAAQDLCLFRVLWWSGCRESEVAGLRRWQVGFSQNPRGLELHWARTKRDSNGMGTSRFVPALPQADPYGATWDWVDLYWPGKTDEDPDNFPLFVRQFNNGDWRENPIHPNSIPSWLRRQAKAAGVTYWDKLSGHSCRHGLATMMSDQIPLREVMDYFKWKRVETAIGYTTNKGVSLNVIDTLQTASLSPGTKSSPRIGQL